MVNSRNSSRKKQLNRVSEKSPGSLKYYLSSPKYIRALGKFTTDSYFQLKKILLSEVELPKKKKHSDDNQKQKSSRKKLDNKLNVKRPDLVPKLNGESSDTNNDKGPLAKKSKNSDSESIKHVVKLSNEILASVTTVFPVDLFPDTIVLDRTTLNITKRAFFFSNDTTSIRIEDILNVKVSVGPFLGTLTVASRVMSSEDHYDIHHLRRKDAIHLKHMILGYVIALHNEIDIAHLSKDELCETITELGHDANS